MNEIAQITSVYILLARNLVTKTPDCKRGWECGKGRERGESTPKRRKVRMDPGGVRESLTVSTPSGSIPGKIKLFQLQWK